MQNARVSQFIPHMIEIHGNFESQSGHVKVHATAHIVAYLTIPVFQIGPSNLVYLCKSSLVSKQVGL